MKLDDQDDLEQIKEWKEKDKGRFLGLFKRRKPKPPPKPEPRIFYIPMEHQLEAHGLASDYAEARTQRETSRARFLLWEFIRKHIPEVAGGGTWKFDNTSTSKFRVEEVLKEE